MSDLSYGYGAVTIKDADGREDFRHGKNFIIPEQVLESVFITQLRSGYTFDQTRNQISQFFYRFGPKRYQPDFNEMVPMALGARLWYDRVSTTPTEWGDWMGNRTSMGGYTNDLRTRRRYFYIPSNTPITRATQSTPIASVQHYAVTYRTPITRWVQPYFPDSWYYYPVLTHIDIPGTKVGNLFKHGPGTNYLFNLTGETILSAGNIEIGGVYKPVDETNLLPRAFRVYYANEGGTGLVTGISGTNGSVQTASPNVFTDGDSGGQFIGGGTHDDGNHYIRTRGTTNGINRGTFLITAVNDGNNVVVDSDLINQPFTTEAGFDWELVTGPVGEYFIQQRTYVHGFRWLYYHYYYSGYTSALPLSGLFESVDDIVPTTAPYRKSIHDRGACWWVIVRNTSYRNVQLFRWTQFMPQGHDMMLRNGSLTNVPAGALTWFDPRDLVIDNQDKIWLAHTPASETVPNTLGRSSVWRIDPYPGGDATNPDVISTWTSQANPTENLPLNYEAGTLVYDKTNNRLWLPSRINTGTRYDGLSYTEDYGVTWKRVSCLTAITGTASVTIGTAAVTGVGTAFTTELAPGDWIRFGAETRSYEVLSITDDLNLTLAENHAAGQAGVALQVGAIAANDTERPHHNNFSHADYTQDAITNPAVCDVDTEGRFYWISTDRNHVCVFDITTGVVQKIAHSSFPVVPESGRLFSLQVNKPPQSHEDVLGYKSQFQNDIWVGTWRSGIYRIYNGSGNEYDPVDFTTPSFTYGNHNQVDAYPATFDLNRVANQHYNGRFIQDPTTGRWCLGFSFRGQGSTGSRYYLRYKQGDHPTDFMENAFGSEASYINNFPSVTQYYINYNMFYDDAGLSSYFFSGGTGSSHDTQISASLNADIWQDLMWDGTQWVIGAMGAWGYASFNFGNGDANGVHAVEPGQLPPRPGFGTRRMHEDFQPFAHGLRIRFVDSGAQQADEFKYDESTAFVCYIGTGKDNTQEATFGVEYHASPTVERPPFWEAPIDIANAWTQDGGIDGGYVNSGSGAALPPFMRGPAERNGYPIRAFGDYTIDTNVWTFNNPQQPQFMAALRIPDELELAADGDTNAGDEFTSQGGHSFTAADVGKSIFIEGASNAANNGQAVILSLVGGDPTQTVQTDKTFLSEVGMRWKLRDIPAVGYVVLAWYYGHKGGVVRNSNINLYSSLDFGQNWDLVKFATNHRAGAVNTGVKHDDGMFWNSFEWNGQANDDNADGNASCSVWWDLTDLPENVRRRQYWKTYFDHVQSSGNTNRMSFITLLDANKQPLGVPPNTRHPDASDELFNNYIPRETRISAYVSVGNGSAVDDGDGDDVTDQITAASENFWEHSGTNNAQIDGSGNFIGPASTFGMEDIGKSIRISGAVNSSNDGFATIVDIVSDAQVVTDKAFTAETNTFDWAVSPLAPGDLVRFNDDTILEPHLARTPAFLTWEILDVPSNTQILLLSKELPLSFVNLPFHVDRSFPGPGSTSIWKYDSNFSSNVTFGYSTRHGDRAWGTPAEFITIASGVGDATTAADTDGDGRVNKITLTATALDNNFKELAVQAGDYILVDSTGHGRRVYEIKTITRDSPAPGQAEIEVTYDELHPSSTYSWSVYRRTGLKCSMRRSIVTTQEVLP